MKKENIRIYCILADENLFHPKYFMGLIAELKKRKYKVVGVTLALDKYKRGLLNAVIEQINLWGILPFSFIVGNSVLRTFLSKSKLSKDKTVRGIAKMNNIPIYETFNVNNEGHINYLEKKKVDIIISSNGHIFKKELLNLPKIAAINRHSALLPSYGGVLPVFWAMKNGEKKLGTSVHYMVERVDKGDILSQYEFENSNDNSLFANYMIAFKLSIPATVDAIENVLRKKIVKKFKHNKNEYYSFPKKKEMDVFRKKKKPFRLVDVFYFYKNY